jgi:hypothetical protein
MAKSEFLLAVDSIQGAIRPLLKKEGFRVRGRTFNRITSDGLTQVINFQMGASDPPGTTYIPGLRENLHGRFAVNLGIYVPEVAAAHGGGEATSWVQDYHCCERQRLGQLIGGGKDIWWAARASTEVIEDVSSCIIDIGLPFLDRFSSRDRILAENRGQYENFSGGGPRRIVSAIILAKRELLLEARELLVQQALETRNPHHPEYVRKLARAIGVGALDG